MNVETAALVLIEFLDFRIVGEPVVRVRSLVESGDAGAQTAKQRAGNEGLGLAIRKTATGQIDIGLVRIRRLLGHDVDRAAGCVAAEPRTLRHLHNPDPLELDEYLRESTCKRPVDPGAKCTPPTSSR